MSQKIKEKLKSPVVWSAIVAQLLSILVLIGVIDVTQSEQWNQTIGYVLQLFVVFGILNNPDNKGGF